MIELGGNIELSGFGEIDGASMVIIKKIVGNYAKLFGERSEFTKLSLHLKPVHASEKSSKYQINIKLDAKGKPFTAEVTEKNLFVGTDAALKKIENMLG